MSVLLVISAVFGPLALLGFGIVPRSKANSSVSHFRQLVRTASVLNAVAAIFCLITSVIQGPTSLSLGLLPASSPLHLTLLFDTTSCLMWTLVASVGVVICQFSIRYLDGDPSQGAYFKWVSLTLSGVSLAVVSGNLFLLVMMLLLTSVGLHYLLTHFSHRDAAHFPARLKFGFSRAADLCLLAASVLLYRSFGTGDLYELFAAISSLSATEIQNTASLQTSAALLAAAAMLKSAQFPFHTWLPETMEAPTPVSALMHAGIVNAGGYLLIRLAPIFVLCPIAMWTVAGLGAFTALTAALTMQSQSSIKRTLAWSTIAQMGFMMLQCGLGAFSAALLHIIAHSLYKAHAFLSSGQVLVEKRATAVRSESAASTSRTVGFLSAAALVSIVFASVLWAFGISLEDKAGGLVLGWVLSLALVRWNLLLLRSGWAQLPLAFGSTALLLTIYFGAFVAVDAAVLRSVSTTGSFAMSGWLMAAIAFAMTLVFCLEAIVSRASGSRWFASLYVHSHNGFYVDVLWRQITRAAVS